MTALEPVVLRVRTDYGARFSHRDSSGSAMDEITSRVVACPHCAMPATVTLHWRPETAWRARIRSFRCVNRCRVSHAVLLRLLGLSADNGDAAR